MRQLLLPIAAASATVCGGGEWTWNFKLAEAKQSWQLGPDLEGFASRWPPATYSPHAAIGDMNRVGVHAAAANAMVVMAMAMAMAMPGPRARLQMDEM